MLNLLIVDDEPLITDSLYDLFLESYMQELNVMKAYSGREALAFMDAARVDILLTDISMPDVNGMEVHRRARALWPDCAVIYLTSFGEFSLVQEAIRNRGEDYILKTEGDAAVLAAVERAAERIGQARNERLAYERARNDLTLAMPLLQAKFLASIAGHGPSDNLGAQFGELGLPFGDGAVILLMARADEWPQGTNEAERLKLAGRVKGAMESHFLGIAAAWAMPDDGSLIEFIQPRAQGADASADCAELALRLWGSLDELQALCRESYGVTVSLAASGPVAWRDVPAACEALKRRLASAAIAGALLTLDPSVHGDDGRSANRVVSFVEEYTQRNIGSDLSLTKFATLLNFHPFYLSRLYKHFAGKSLTEYVAAARMARAREMLRSGNVKITDISASLGFKTSSYFTCFFRKYEGISPGEYRNLK